MYLGTHFVQLMFQWYTESALLWTNSKKATLDTIGKRLHPDTEKEKWLESNQPKWHSKCRNWFIHKKSFKLAEKKRLSITIAEMELKSGDPQAGRSSVSSRTARSGVDQNEAQIACVIYNQQWFRWMKSESKVSTLNSQRSFIEKSQAIKQERCSTYIDRCRSWYDN